MTWFNHQAYAPQKFLFLILNVFKHLGVIKHPRPSMQLKPASFGTCHKCTGHQLDLYTKWRSRTRRRHMLPKYNAHAVLTFTTNTTECSRNEIVAIHIRAYFSEQLIMICAAVKWKCAAETGNLCSFILHCLNEPSIYNGITILYSVVLNWYCRFEVLKWHFTQTFSASGVLCPRHLGHCHWTLLGAMPPDPHNYSENVQNLIFLKICPYTNPSHQSPLRLEHKLERNLLQPCTTHRCNLQSRWCLWHIAS